MALTTELLKRFHAHSGAWGALYEALADVDVLLAFCDFAVTAECATCRPVFTPEGGRHVPVHHAAALRIPCESEKMHDS